MVDSLHEIRFRAFVGYRDDADVPDRGGPLRAPPRGLAYRYRHVEGDADVADPPRPDAPYSHGEVSIYFRPGDSPTESMIQAELGRPPSYRSINHAAEVTGLAVARDSDEIMMVVTFHPPKER